MIGYLKGKILEKNLQSVLLLVQDIGYEVYISEKVYYQLGEVNDEVAFLIYTSVREDAIELFGFIDPLDKKLFLNLISVSGIGAKSAIQILGKTDSFALVQAIVKSDVIYLTKLPGVGKKTANRMIVELADKLEKEYDLADKENKPLAVSSPNSMSEVLTDVIEGLKGLGYTEKEIMPIIDQIEVKDGSMEMIFKLVLSKLAKGR